ncbi:MAG TPA: NAD(P)H-hydrate dehydratase [candidate division Zixibacteria bacterium]|nr:NAD(P)H-hydrate dehydratase [candidate division Zixibacteria bacterium]
MKLVTSDEMRQVDRETIDQFGIPGPELMENAGFGIAERILAMVSPEDDGYFTVICGKGNNGGDGFVVARYLHEAGCEVEVFFVGPPEKLSPDARLNYNRALDLDLNLTEIISIESLPEELNSDYIIDAVFGTGFSGAPRGITAELIEYMNDQPQPVLAVDMPSGLNADTGQHEGAVVRAVASYTLALPKYGLYVSPGRELSGPVQVVPIGVPDEVLRKFDFRTDLISPFDVKILLPQRQPEGHKGNFGKLLILAGSTGMTGAAALAGKAAFRSGSGLVKIACPRSCLPLIASQILEATSWPLPDVAKKGALAMRGLGEVRALLKEQDAIAIGPGIGQHRETAELVRRLLTTLDKPAVIDADGLNVLAGHMDIVRECPAPLVLTPHPGEFKRLSGKSVPTDIHGRLAIAREFASEYDVVLVLKGSPTVVADPKGNAWVNSTGNNGMATGGSGDVLTGAIGSLLGQGLDAIDAAVCGVFVHGLAGDLAALDLGARSMIAGDLVEFLPDAYLAIEG